MSFFSSFFAICRGPYAAGTLQNHSWGRVIWHLFLMCFFCCVLIGIGNYIMLNINWRSAYGDFNEIFGTRLVVSNKGVQPDQSHNPDVSRRQELPYNTLLLYISGHGPENYPDETLCERNVIVLWTLSGFAAFIRKEDIWSMLSYDANGSMSLSEQMNFEGMKEKLMEFARRPPSDNWVFPSEYNGWISSRELFDDFRLAYAVGIAFRYLLFSLMMLFLTTLFFSGMFRLFSFNRVNMIPFGKLWKVALYTAFPVLMVVSVFPALQLPGAGYYNNLFLIGWAGYLFFVIRYLQLNPGEEICDENGEKNG